MENSNPNTNTALEGAGAGTSNSSIKNSDNVTVHITETLIRKHCRFKKANNDRVENIASLNLHLSEGYTIPRVEGLEKLTGLERLNLSYNSIVCFEKFSFLTSLRELNLAENRISKFAAHSFVGLRNLERLNLSGNLIQRIPKDISELSKLQTLRLGRNQLDTLDDILFLKKLERLSNLSLSGNPISQIAHLKAYVVYSLKSLDVVDSETVTLQERIEAKTRFEQLEIDELCEKLMEKERVTKQLASANENRDAEISHLKRQNQIYRTEANEIQRQRDHLLEETRTKTELLNRKAEQMSTIANELIFLREQLAYRRIDKICDSSKNQNKTSDEDTNYGSKMPSLSRVSTGQDTRRIDKIVGNKFMHKGNPPNTPAVSSANDKLSSEIINMKDNLLELYLEQDNLKRRLLEARNLLDYAKRTAETAKAELETLSQNEDDNFISTLELEQSLANHEEKCITYRHMYNDICRRLVEIQNHRRSISMRADEISNSDSIPDEHLPALRHIHSAISESEEGESEDPIQIIIENCDLRGHNRKLQQDIESLNAEIQLMKVQNQEYRILNNSNNEAIESIKAEASRRIDTLQVELAEQQEIIKSNYALQKANEAHSDLLQKVMMMVETAHVQNWTSDKCFEFEKRTSEDIELEKVLNQNETFRSFYVKCKDWLNAMATIHRSAAKALDDHSGYQAQERSLKARIIQLEEDIALKSSKVNSLTETMKSLGFEQMQSTKNMIETTKQLKLLQKRSTEASAILKERRKEVVELETKKYHLLQKLLQYKEGLKETLQEKNRLRTQVANEHQPMEPIVGVEYATYGLANLSASTIYKDEGDTPIGFSLSKPDTGSENKDLKVEVTGNTDVNHIHPANSNSAEMRLKQVLEKLQKYQKDLISKGQKIVKLESIIGARQEELEHVNRSIEQNKIKSDEYYEGRKEDYELLGKRFKEKREKLEMLCDEIEAKMSTKSQVEHDIDESLKEKGKLHEEMTGFQDVLKKMKEKRAEMDKEFEQTVKSHKKELNNLENSIQKLQEERIQLIDNKHLLLTQVNYLKSNIQILDQNKAAIEAESLTRRNNEDSIDESNRFLDVINVLEQKHLEIKSSFEQKEVEMLQTIAQLQQKLMNSKSVDVVDILTTQKRQPTQVDVLEDTVDISTSQAPLDSEAASVTEKPAEQSLLEERSVSKRSDTISDTQHTCEATQTSPLASAPVQIQSPKRDSIQRTKLPTAFDVSNTESVRDKEYSLDVVTEFSENETHDILSSPPNGENTPTDKGELGEIVASTSPKFTSRSPSLHIRPTTTTAESAHVHLNRFGNVNVELVLPESDAQATATPTNVNIAKFGLPKNYVFSIRNFQERVL